MYKKYKFFDENEKGATIAPLKFNPFYQEARF
jgi:hypothetical protein